MDMKMIHVLLVMCELFVIGSAYQQCNIICDGDHLPSPSSPHAGLPGKAGPSGATGDNGQKGETGEQGEAAESCECPSFDDMRAEIATMKEELTKLQRNPRDCLDIRQTYPMLISGVYRIFPLFENTTGFQVYCDMETDGGGWIVFQKRQDGSVDFFRNWDEYVHGFGEFTGEFWLGLDLLHQLTTTNGTFDLRIDLTDFEQNSAYAHYSSFSIGEGTDYQLNFNEYTGTAGQGLNKYKFSTNDRDQDTWPKNCASNFKGAWWYTNCHSANLNGLYLEGKTDQYATGMVYEPWKGHYYALKTSQMKFRRVDV